MFRNYILLKRIVFLSAILISLQLHAKAQRQFSVAYYHDAVHTGISTPLNQLIFTPVDDNHRLNPLDNKGVYLFKIKFTGPPPKGARLVIIENEHLDSIYLYRKQADSLALLSIFGNNIRNDSTLLGYPKLIIRDRSQEYYFKIHFKQEVNFPITIDPANNIMNQISGMNFEAGLYYGFCAIIFLGNLFMFLTFKQRIFIYYSFFQLFVCLSIFSSDALFTLVTHNKFILNHADMPLHLGIAISGFLFSGYFMGVQNHYLYKKWILLAFTTLIVLAYGVYLIFDFYYALLAGDIIVFSLLLVYWISGLTQFKQHIFARYFVFAYGVYLLFAIDYYILRKFGFFAFNLFKGQLKIGSVIEMIVLSLTVAYKVNELRNENLRYRKDIESTMHKSLLEKAAVKREITDMFAKAKDKYNLTEREVEVLKCITEGLNNSEISDKLFVSHNTIKYHTRNIYEKMEITSRAQAVSRIHEKS